MLTGVTALLFALCCLPLHAAKFVVVPALLALGCGGVIAADLKRIDTFRSARDLQFLAFGLLWTLASGLATELHLSNVAALLSNVLLLMLLGLTVRGVAAAGLQRQFLALFVGFATLGAALSIAAHLHGGHGLERLRSVALNGQIIPAAGRHACALLAAIALLRTGADSRAKKGALWLAIGLLALALAWSQSRGPIMSFMLALLWLPVSRLTTSRVALLTACLLAYAATSCAILFEQDIHAALCASNLARICDPSMRLELWGWSVASIVKHPLFGVGFGNYFTDPYRPHPHNGLLALAFFAGLPMLAGFLALFMDAALRLLKTDPGPLAFYAAPALIFGFGYMGTDLANALGFIGAHYFFVWLPIFVAYGRASDARSAAAPGLRNDILPAPAA